MSRQSLNKRLTRLETSAAKEPVNFLVVGLIEDAPKDFGGNIIATGVPRPEDKLHRQCE